MSGIGGNMGSSSANSGPAVPISLVNGGFGQDVSGATGLPIFAAGSLVIRALQATDIPALDAAKVATGVLATGRLGSGTASANTVLTGTGWTASPGLTSATFSSLIYSANNQGIVCSVGNGSIAFCGGTNGTQAAGSSVLAYGNSHATKPGYIEHYTGNSGIGSRHSFFSSSGAEQVRIDGQYGLQAGFLSPFTGSGTLGLGTGGSGTSVQIKDRLSVSSSGTYTDPGAGRVFAERGLQFGIPAANPNPATTLPGIYATDTSTANQVYNAPLGWWHLFSTGGATRAIINAAGVFSISGAFLTNGGPSALLSNSNGSGVVTVESQTTNLSGRVQIYGSTATQSAGTVVTQVVLKDRPNSTTHDVCAVQSGGVTDVTLQDLVNVQRAVVHVAPDGTSVTVTGAAEYEAAGTPSATGKLCFYVSAGRLIMAVGSAAGRKVGFYPHNGIV